MPIYLKYGDKIKGEVKEPAHRGWIELQSAQWGVGRGMSNPTGRSTWRESSSPNVSEIVVTKELDSISVFLQQEALSGDGVVAKIEFTRADGSVYLRLEMSGTMISAYSLSGRGNKPTESLSLSCTKVEFKNIPGTPTTTYDEVP